MMRTALLVLGALLLGPDPAAAEELASTSQARTLTYPELAEEGAAPPELKLDVGGAPLTMYFPGEQLDPRPEVHLVSAPERVELRVAEKSAYLLSLGPSAAAGPVMLTLTLDGGRPLSFQLVPSAAGEVADSLVEVRLPEAAARTECPARLSAATDALAACEKGGEDEGIDLLAGWLAASDPTESPAMVRRVGWRNKKDRIYVEVVDVLRLGGYSFVRMVIENRDPQGTKWWPGEPQAQVVDPREPRRLKVHTGVVGTAIGPKEKLTVVVGFQTPQLTRGTHLRIMIPEAEGKRHVVVEKF